MAGGLVVVVVAAAAVAIAAEVAVGRMGGVDGVGSIIDVAAAVGSGVSADDVVVAVVAVAEGVSVEDGIVGGRGVGSGGNADSVVGAAAAVATATATIVVVTMWGRRGMSTIGGVGSSMVEVRQMCYVLMGERTRHCICAFVRNGWKVAS